MEVSWQSKWQQIEDKETCKTILERLADPGYVPLTSTNLAVNELKMVGQLYKDYMAARDQLVKLDFIDTGWGWPIELSGSFKEFITLQGSNWFDVLEGHKKAVPAPTPPEKPPVPAPERTTEYPTKIENEEFWNRFHAFINPLLLDNYAASGEVLYIDTARQGSRFTGGTYSRPDLTYVAVGRYPLLGERFVRIVSVEAKTWDYADDVSNAYEAVAYKRFSTQVYYAYESPDSMKRISNEVTEILRENGVGIIRIWREGDKDAMRIDLDSVPSDPSPDKLETYLGVLLQIQEKDLVKLLHSKYR